MYTKLFNFFSWFSIIVLSFLLYFIYLIIADYVQSFVIYKTLSALLSSPLFYLSVILVVGIAVIIDVFYIAMEREIRTPLFLLYKSLLERKMANQEKVEGFDNIVTHMQKKMAKKPK